MTLLRRLAHLRAAALLLILLTVSGCREADRLYAYLQHAGPKLSFSPGKMTMTIGDGEYDLHKVIAKQRYAGEVRKGRVTVAYIEGTLVQAEDAAEAFDRMYSLARERLGLPWSFDLTVKLVDAADVPDGWFYSEKLRANGKMTFPLVIDRESGEISPLDAAVIAHEVTEASLLRPDGRKGMLLSDAWLGESTFIAYHTRWFRDGMSDYAANLFSVEVLGRDPVFRPDFARLAELRESILKWENPGNEEDYPAALALIYEIVFRCGEESLPAIANELKKSKAAGGSDLRSAVLKATALDLRRFLSTYETPWLGFSVAASKTGGVVVGRVWDGSPGARWKIQTGDIVKTIAGRDVKTAWDFRLQLAQQKVGERVPVIIERHGVTFVHDMKTIPHPRDLRRFNKQNSRDN